MIKRADSQTFDRGDVSFIILSGALVSFMIPGLALLYAGLARRKSALALIWVVCASNAIVILQWVFWGYSLAFSPSATNGFIGDLAHFGLKGVLGNPSAGSPLIPDLLYAFFQMEFAAVTVAIVVGATAERGRVLPPMILSFLWVTFVYCPLACWAWNTNGWAAKWGVVDFAGGGPVEIGSGMAGLAYSLVLGPRQKKELVNYRPQNATLVMLGTWILWLGWIGFNAGSAFGANLRAIVAAWNSFICAALGGITWCIIDFFFVKKWSMIGLCAGTIAGLVAATPSSGFVPPWASIIIGILAGGICNMTARFKHLLRVDDALDIFAAHAMGGIIGLLANGIFTDANIVALDGVSSAQGGWLNHNWKQIYKQFFYVVACCVYSFGITYLLAKGLDMIPGLHLRVTSRAEAIGIDETEIGEFVTDYVEVRRDPLAFTPTSSRLKVLNVTRDAHNDGRTSITGDRHIIIERRMSNHVVHCLESPKQPAAAYDSEKQSCHSGLSVMHEYIARLGEEYM